MALERTHNRPLAGIAFICAGVLAISVNDLLIKLLSGDYPLHQIVFTRSVIGISFSLLLVQFEGGWSILKTNQPVLHALRGILIVIANMTFFVALAVLSLGEATALFFVAPLMITLLSVPFLGETLGPMRICAVLVGFLGVLIMTQPWSGEEARVAPFYIYILPLIGALTYAANQVLTRKLGVESKASAMAVYIQTAFIIVSIGFFVIAGDGRFAKNLTDPSMIFLLRAWVLPTGNDIWLFLGLGTISAVVGYSLAQAYRLANPAIVAPFEYLGLPLAIFWGWFLFAELPTFPILIGILLIFGSGLFVFLREYQNNRRLLRSKRIQMR
ncbi:MAG: DMT family transporter [Pseudomonadota bacterium]